MILLLLASLGGTGVCGVVHAQAYSAPIVSQSYGYQAKQVYYAPAYDVKYRASYVGYTVADEEKARQLLIIEQQSKALAKVIEQQDQQIRQLTIERSSMIQSMQQQPPPEEPPPPLHGQGQDRRDEGPPPIPQPPTASATVTNPIVGIFQNRCAKCHTGEQGRANRWIMDRNSILKPGIELRLLVNEEIQSGRMPKGAKLSPEEKEAFRQWASFSKEELRASMASKSKGDFN